ncbi:MAG: tetratricopeptide repeat protein, partial [Gemmatimonadota bacterium]
AALEKVLPRLGDYLPAIAALGSDYVDRAGIVKQPAPLYDRAAAALERALTLEPTYPPARAKLASLYAKIGKSERAVELLREGLTQHPHYAPYHETLGYVLRYAGLMQPSIDSYSEGQKLDASLDNLVSTQDQITKSYIYLLDFDRAIESHRRMRAFLERAKRVPDEKQWFYEGVIHLYRGDTAAAVAAFGAGERRLPNSVWTTFGRGYTAMAQNDRARAGAVLDELERQEIVDGERHYRLVHFAVFAGRTDRALHHLRVSVDGGLFNAPYIASDPWLATLRARPQFAQVLNTARRRHEAVKRSLATNTRQPSAGHQ